ncbi:uncharacterized protein LOC141622679 [Silene latifolia]|uniref:uncharacterized protein LOC141622679 n=1 Tax=Silene latifolia TaxID=37657 RepID=UPI003D76DA89
MDLTTPKYYHPTSPFPSSQEELEECKTKGNPFAETIISNEIDPICKLNLKETSEFVKSLPMSNSTNSTTQRRKSTEVFMNNNNSPNLRKLETPTTPGRPVFSFSVARKSIPSKWDDAEKWLVNGSSCHESPARHSVTNHHSISNHTHNFIFGSNKNVIKPRLSCDAAIAEKVSRFIQEKEEVISSSIAFNGLMLPADLPLKDKYTDEIEPFTPNFKYSEPTTEAFLFKSHKLQSDQMKDACTEMIPYKEVQHRDFGTEMTPLGSSTTSRCHTPFKSNSPARHNTPSSRSGLLALTAEPSAIDMAQLQECHFAKLQIGSTPFDSVTTNWSSREEEEEEISKSLRHFELGRRSVSVSESRASVWEEEEKTKSCLRYRREEAKIQAWINLQTAKAEAQSKKLEVKIQKMRSNLEEKLMKRMAIVERKAEEWREAAQVEHSEQIRKATERAQKLKLNKHIQNSHLSSHIVSCGCFPCTSNH